MLVTNTKMQTEMGQPRVLIATTTWWPSAARLAVSFLNYQAIVSAICPRGNALHALAARLSIQTYSSVFPLSSLIQAITKFKPDIIVPTDDRTVRDLHALHASAATDDPQGLHIKALIERSLGASSCFGLSGTRDHLLRTVGAAGVKIPFGSQIESPQDLAAWFEASPGRCVLKIEGSWGGSGVIVVDTLEAAQTAFLRMSRPLTFRHALRLLVFDRDPFPFMQFLRKERPLISVQEFIDGRQANIMVACWNGKVLDTLGVEVIRAQNGTGAATVVRMQDAPEMGKAAAVVAGSLSASGFIGLDFVIQSATQACYLIEVNPRATQLGHIERRGRSLVLSLLNELAGTSLPDRTALDDEVLAFFPQALRFDREWLESNPSRVDVPWSEPRLVRELLKRPWTKRGVLSRMKSYFRRNSADGIVLSPREAKRLLASYMEKQRPGGCTGVTGG